MYSAAMADDNLLTQLERRFKPPGGGRGVGKDKLAAALVLARDHTLVPGTFICDVGLPEGSRSRIQKYRDAIRTEYLGNAAAPLPASLIEPVQHATLEPPPTASQAVPTTVGNATPHHPTPRGPKPKVNGETCTWDAHAGCWHAPDGSEHRVQDNAARQAERERMRERCVQIEIEAIRRTDYQHSWPNCKFYHFGVCRAAVLASELGSSCDSIKQLDAVVRSAGTEHEPTPEALEAMWWRWSPLWHIRGRRDEELVAPDEHSHPQRYHQRRAVKAAYERALQPLLEREGLQRGRFDATLVAARSSMREAESQARERVAMMLADERRQEKLADEQKAREEKQRDEEPARKRRRDELEAGGGLNAKLSPLPSPPPAATDLNPLQQKIAELRAKLRAKAAVGSSSTAASLPVEAVSANGANHGGHIHEGEGSSGL